jgi:hypothetical protein
LAVVAIVLLTIISAVGGDSRQVGSSYSISANGYHAWYQMMSSRGVKINRWQKPFSQLIQFPEYKQGIALLQVQPQLERLSLTSQQQQWVSQGNTLIVLGITAPSGEIPFQTDLASPQGNIRIETTRRFNDDIGSSKLLEKVSQEVILSDRSGSVITQLNLDSPGERLLEMQTLRYPQRGGRIIIATTPYLAANAYQDFRPNYELLAELVTKDRQQVLVDEYIHGYIDRDRKSVIDPKTGKITTDDESNDVLKYLATTPLIVVFVNLLLGILVLAWQQNRRFGKVIIPKTAEIDNSEAYIQALGGVLRQANSSEFVLQNIGKSEQLSWQQKLGLGKERLVSPQSLITAWETQTQLPTEDLRSVLELMTRAHRLSPAELTSWLTKIREIDRQLESRL